MTFTQIKQNIKDNLEDQGVHFSTGDLTLAVQNAYDEVVALSQCIIKKVTLNFQSNLNYYNFKDPTNFPNISVTDFMACTAIFSNLTNLWLLDDKTIKDFDRDRIDWEGWEGSSIWWTPTMDYRRVALVPKQTTASGTFDLYYWATAPTVVDGDTPLIPADFTNLIELHATAALCEIAREFTKANEYLKEFWGIDDDDQNFDDGIYALATRSKNIVKSDLLLLA